MMTKGNQDTLRVRFLSFDATARVFLLAISSHSHHSSAPAKRRDIGDFQALDRAVAHGAKSTDATTAAVPRLSLRRLKKLTETSWQRDDATAGWRRELQKNVAACEQWLEVALTAADASMRLRFVDDDAFAAHHRTRAELQQRSQRAKQLQQYFTSESLVQYVVARVRDVLADQRLPRIDSEHVLWVEPSCGDGRIIEALVAAGAKHVLGCELDERVWAIAHAKLEHVQGVTIHHGDFLTSSPPPVITETTTTTTIMAVGNPPFGDDTATSAKRDLVAKFVIHNIRVWRAQLVAFIVPSRCAKPTYLETLLAAMNGESDADQQTAHGEVRDSTTWSVVVNEPIEDCTFEFQATKRVKQPSAFVVLALHPAEVTETATSKKAVSQQFGSPGHLGTGCAASGAAQC